VLEKEALRILASCLKWHQWIYGHKILALTDHRALELLESTAQPNSIIARWKIILSNYNLETRYRKGSIVTHCRVLKFEVVNLLITLSSGVYHVLFIHRVMRACNSLYYSCNGL